MLRPLAWLIRWISLAALASLAIAALRCSLFSLRAEAGWDGLFRSPALWTAFSGLIARLLLTRWRRRDPMEFLDTLEHELTHAVAGYATFAPPVSLKATLRKGGEVELRRTNPVAALAPYFLPLYAAVFSLLTVVLNPALQNYGQLATAFLLGGFAYRMGREMHLGQTDFREYGFVFSFCAIAALLPISLIAILDAAHILDISWSGKVWPVFLDQIEWAWRLIAGFA